VRHRGTARAIHNAQFIIHNFADTRLKLFRTANGKL